MEYYISCAWIFVHSSSRGGVGFEPQFLHYHLKSNETIPWIHMQMEIDCYISYNHNNKRYVVLGMSVFGVDDFEGFCYGYRDGNELKLIQKGNGEADPKNISIQRYTWEPISKSWNIQ